jgi:hypothetical protein
VTAKGAYWKWISHEGHYFYNVGVGADGTLHNPRNYPEDEVRAAIAGAQERARARRSSAARKAAVTRRKRQDQRVYEAARRIVDGEVFGPADSCFICWRHLDDPESVRRGIGSECWQGVLERIRAARAAS